MAPQKADEPKPVLMWILAMKGNSSTCFTMFPLTILYWVLQQTPSSFSLHSRFFSFERSSSHSEEKDGKLSSFVCSDLNSGQFSLRLHRHTSLHSPEKKKAGPQPVNPPVLLLQHTCFASLLQTSSFSSETSFSHSGEKEVNPSSFFCSALKAGQFSLDLHSHPSWHRPENITLNDAVELYSHLTYHIPSDCWPNAKHTVARRSTRVILRPLGAQRFSLY